MKKSSKFLAGASLALALVVGGAVSPANAETLTATGTIGCPSGQYGYVRVDTTGNAVVRFYIGTSLKGTSSGQTPVHYFGQQGFNWRVTSTSNIGAVYDGCSPATR